MRLTTFAGAVMLAAMTMACGSGSSGGSEESGGTGGNGGAGTGAPPAMATAEPAGEEERETMPGTESVTMLTWRHSGGIAGICRELIVTIDGNYSLVNCIGDEVLAEGELEAGQLDPLLDYYKTNWPFEWSNTPPVGGADVVQMSLLFGGEGEDATDEDERNEIAQQVYALANEIERGTR